MQRICQWFVAFRQARPRAWRDGSNNWQLRCIERTRTGGELRNYTGITRDSQLAGWDLEILDPADDAVVRTLSGLTEPTYAYTPTEQTADFGAVQDRLKVRWYQLSSEIGRGFKAEIVETIP